MTRKHLKNISVLYITSILMLTSCIIDPVAAQLKLDYAREGILYYEPCAKPAKQKPEESDKDKNKDQPEENVNDGDTTTISRSTDNQTEVAGDQSEEESTTSQAEEAKERSSSGQATVLCCDDVEPTGNAVTVAGGSNQEKVFNYLVSKGFTAEQAAGAVGNIIAESGDRYNPQVDFRTDPVNSIGATGMVQWTDGRRANLMKLAAARGKPWQDIEVQIYLMGWELGLEGDDPLLGKPTHKKVGDSMRAATTIEETTLIWLEDYERPCLKGQCGHEFSTRLPAAKHVYEKFGDSAPKSNAVSKTTDACAEDGAVAAEGFVYYNQGDPQWNNQGLPIALAGCGPTSLAMIIATLKDKSVNPVVTAQYLQSIGSWDSNGLKWHGIPTIAKKYNLEYTDLGTDWEAAKKSLREGKLIMISGQGPSPFTSGGHLIVGKGVTEDGKIIIANPGDKSQESTPFATPIPGLMHIWAFQ